MNITEQDLPKLLGKKITAVKTVSDGKLRIIKVGTAEIKAWANNPAVTGCESWETVPGNLGLELKPNKNDPSVMDIWAKPPAGGGGGGKGGGGAAKADPEKMAGERAGNINNVAGGILSGAVSIYMHTQPAGQPFDMNKLKAIADDLERIHGDLVKELQERRK